MIKTFRNVEVTIRDVDTGREVTYRPHSGDVFVQPPTNGNTLTLTVMTPYEIDRSNGGLHPEAD